jgi:hypothetical protein
MASDLPRHVSPLATTLTAVSQLEGPVWALGLPRLLRETLICFQDEGVLGLNAGLCAKTMGQVRAMR